MNRHLGLLLLAAALSGCVSFDQSEINQVRQRGVSSHVAAKLDRGCAVAPADVVELTRCGVRDEWIIRQLEDHGVDSYVSRSDLSSLRRAGVHPPVIEALLRESRRFAENYYYRDSAYFGSYYDGVLATLRGGSEHNMLNLSEKQIRKARAHFGGDFSEGLEGVLCGYSCPDGGWVDWVECAEHAATV